MHDARVLDGFDGFKFQWQYEGDFGWKKYRPSQNGGLKTAHAQGYQKLVIWDEKDYLRVDFERMKQTMQQHAGQDEDDTHRRVRLVALRELDSEST